MTIHPMVTKSWKCPEAIRPGTFNQSALINKSAAHCVLPSVYSPTVETVRIVKKEKKKWGVGQASLFLKQYYEICLEVRPRYTFYSTKFLSFAEIDRTSRIDNLSCEYESYIRVVVVTQFAITFPLPGSRYLKLPVWYST